MPRGGPEAVSGLVGNKEGNAAGPQVNKGCLDGHTQIVQCKHVVDGIVDEDRIELAFEPQRAHISADVRAIGIELTTDAQHSGGKIHKGHLELALEM